MIGTLTFKLPEENEEHRLALNAGKWMNVVSDLDQWLRDGLKYGKFYSEHEEAYQACRMELLRLTMEEGLDGDI